MIAGDEALTSLCTTTPVGLRHCPRSFDSMTIDERRELIKRTLMAYETLRDWAQPQCRALAVTAGGSR
jgi:hypothetical protein